MSTFIGFTASHAVERNRHLYGLRRRAASASPGKAQPSLGVTCLFSFAMSVLVTLFVCDMIPAPPFSLLALRKDRQGSGKDCFSMPVENGGNGGRLKLPGVAGGERFAEANGSQCS